MMTSHGREWVADVIAGAAIIVGISTANFWQWTAITGSIAILAIGIALRIRRLRQTSGMDIE